MMEWGATPRGAMEPDNPSIPDPEAAADVSRRAATYCRWNFPSQWKAGPPTWDTARRRWVIPVLLTPPSGVSIELGQLTFDGETLRLSTARHIMTERARGERGA